MKQSPSPGGESDLFVILSQETGQRIDKLLSERFSSFSRSYFQHLIESGSVLLNGMQVKKRVAVSAGDEVEVCFQLTPELSLAPEPMSFEILFEDEHLLAINKPPGMVVHPAPGHPTGTFVNGLLAYCQSLPLANGSLRPGIVHRLDKDTSGVLIAAKTREAHQKIIELFSQRKMGKLYLAICCGRPPNEIVEAPIGRHPIHRKKMAIVPEGREAVSHVQVAAFNEKTSLVLVRPKTGRTHQIRVHLKHVGHPILGDAVYGNHRMNQSLSPSRLLLHAYRLSFIHPCTQKPLCLSAPIPDDMKRWVRELCDPAICPPILDAGF